MDCQAFAAASSVPGDPAAAGSCTCDDLGQARLFEQAMRHAAIGMALVTAEGRFLEVNDALCRMLGRDEGTLRQLLLRDVTHPDDLAESLQLVEEMVAGRREAFQLEKRYLHGDGHLIWGQVSVSCLRSGGQCLFIVQIVDISEARRQRLALAAQEEEYRRLAENAAAQEEEYRLLAENAADVVCRLDPQGCITWLSPSVQRCLGWRPEQLLGKSLEAISEPDDQPSLQALQGQARDAVVLNLRLRCADGQRRWMSVKARPICSAEGEGIGWISGWRDIQAEVEMRQQLDRALSTDPLTGLARHSTMLQRIATALARRDPSAITAVLSIGIDRLSQVNNALTHRAGDLLIATVASRLVQALDQPECAARGRGDTFLVLLDQLASPEEAGVIAERLRLASKGPISFEDQTIEPSVSIGLVIAHRDPRSQDANGPTADELIRDAALAMRAAAQQGRDRWVFADPALAQRAQRTLVLQQQLHLGLERGELQTWFMPVVDLSSGALQGYEALVRWQRPNGQLVLPDDFLPIAHSAQMAEAIDLQVLQQSIAALAELPEPLSVATNLSAETLARPGLVERVQQWLMEAGVAPKRLHLEITETTLLHLSAEVMAAIQALAALGVRWQVDDFGTGFSSISHLRDLPIHGLKLDRSFTEGLRNGDQKSVRLAQALAGLAEGLGLHTIAEGIESADEAVSLRDLGWCCGQGWFFGQAAPLSHWQTTAIPAVGGSRSACTAPLMASSRSWALAVTDTVPVGLFALRLEPDGNPHFLFVSRRWLEMLQLEREQIMADFSLILERTHPDDRAGLSASWQTHTAQGTPLAWEGRLLIRDVTTWVLVEATPLPQADGSCIWQGVMSDITRRKQRELHLRRILDEAPIAMAINDLRGDDPRITYVNEQFIQCFGYDLSTIPRLSDWARLAYPDPQQRTAVFQVWDASVTQARSSDGVVAPLEAEITTADGRVRQVLISAVLLGDAEMVVSLMDITAWRQAERELQQARSVLAENALAITEAIPVGTYTMVLPPQGGMASFSFMSERFLEICGLKREDIDADPLKVFACVHPDDRERLVQITAEAFAHKQPFSGECRVVVDGEVRWVRAESVPRDLPDGSTVWEGVVIDTSDHHNALKQLEQERALLNTVLSHIDAQVYMKDRQGRYLYANASTEQLLRHGVESIVGRTDADLMPAEAAQALQEVDEQVFREGGPLCREEYLPLASGGKQVFLSKKLLLQQPGREDFLIGFSTDITELRQATEQLAASEEHFRLLAENSSDVVFRLDLQGQILWVSPSLTSALGWLPEDWVGQVGTRFLVHRGEAEHYQINAKSLQMGGGSVIAREQIYAKDGSIHWIETHAGPYFSREGVVDGIVASFRLIDAIVEAEQQLRQSEQRHRLLADNIQDVVWSIDLQGRFTYMSPSVERLRGFSPQEVIAMPRADHFTPASYAIVQAGLAQAQADARAGRPIAFEAVLEEICKDGSTVWTDVKATGLYGEQGEVLGVVGVTRDITARHQLQESLRISEERYRLLAENARDVIWTMEADGRISYVSPSIQLLRGFSPEEAMAQSIEQIHPPESLRRSQAYFHQLLADLQANRSPQPFRDELEYYCRDGSTIWAEVIALPTFNEQGAFLKLLGVSRDITERKHYERQLREANQQLEQLATTDGLTGIWNRRQIEASIQKALDRSDRYGEPLSLILCDIDHFKVINDRQGHPVGDQVLIEFCRRIQQHLRSSDGFGRWGGEEFLILLDQSDRAAAMALAEKLRQLIAGTPFPQVGTITASFGVAQRREQESAIDWVQRVDQQLYAAKEGGRNRVVGA